MGFEKRNWEKWYPGDVSYLFRQDAKNVYKLAVNRVLTVLKMKYFKSYTVKVVIGSIEDFIIPF